MITQEAFFNIITDANGHVLNEEELKEMQLEGLIRLLQEQIKKMDYLHEDDKRMILYLVHMINGISGF